MTATGQRDTAVDALRALALLPVVAVNWVGYATLPDGGPLGAAQPAGSWWSQLWLIVIASLMAGKGVTLLSFLFGYSQALSRRARDADATTVRRRRMKRLLALGLVHGLLVYMGDILTSYALCGLLMLNWAKLPLRLLKRRLMILVALELLLLLPMAAWLLVGGSTLQPEVVRSLAQPMAWAAWLKLNAGGFTSMQLTIALLGLPLPLALMTAGLIAERLRLFSHRRWRGLLARCSNRWLVPALLLNLVWGLMQADALRADDARREYIQLSLYIFPAALLLMGLVPRLVLASQRGAAWARALAPAGRHTLSIYLGSSLLSLFVLSGAGLALKMSTATLAILSVMYWSLWLILAPRIQQRRLPLEAWLAR